MTLYLVQRVASLDSPVRLTVWLHPGGQSKRLGVRQPQTGSMPMKSSDSKVGRLPLGSKHWSVVSLRLTKSLDGGPARATMSARCLNGSWEPLVSNMSPNKCSPSKRSQIYRSHKWGYTPSGEVGGDRLCYQTCDVPDIDGVSPRHLEYNLWCPVDMWLDERARLLHLPNSCLTKVTENGKSVAVAPNRPAESSALVNGT